MRFLISFFLILTAQLVSGQSFNGFIHSDFSGVIGAQLQPANLAGSPYKYDFSILNGNYFLTNNAAYLAEVDGVRGFVRNTNDTQRFLHGNIALGGFSGMISLPANESLGFTYRVRAHGSALDFSSDFITQLGRFTRPQFLNNQAQNQSGEFATALWRELGLTYAKVIKDDGFHRWKAGGTVKMINSRGSAYVDVNDVDYSTDANGVTTLTNAQLAFGYSSNLNEFEQFDGSESLNRLPDLTGNKVSFDFGLVYERVAFREAAKDENGTNRNRDIDYEFKLSASITDLGALNFDHGSASARSLGLLSGFNVS